MSRRMLRANLIGAALCGMFALPAHAEPAAPGDCARLYDVRLATDLKLGYEQFDQTEGQGFRALAALGCDREAADLIEAYMAANGAAERSLRWHVAQLRATHGDSAAAVRHARAVLSEREDFAQSALRWNDYVLATIAFLERDRAALRRHRDRVAEGREAHFGNALNLKLLDALLRHFERDYRYATSHIE